jgi:ribosomal protein S30
VQEKDFFNEKTESKPHNINCPSCRQSAEYQIRWIRRTKKPSLPPRASEDDRARFKAARDYMVRVDDVLLCSNPRCRKRIEITSLQSVILL